MTTENNASSQQLREAQNNIVIEGLLLEKDITEGEGNDKSKFIRGTFTIETAENEQHQVNMSASEFKKDGGENSLYAGLQTIKNEYKSVAEVGREEAHKVRVDRGQLQLNEYVGRDGQLKSFPRIRTPFMNRVEAGEEYVPQAGFEVEVVVQSVTPEIDRETEDETGRVKLKAIIPLYGGKVIPFDFVVNKDGSPYVEDNYSNGDTVFVYGDIVNFKEKKEVRTESAFGADKIDTIYRTKREYEISGGLEPYEEDDVKAYNIDTIKKALAEREVFLEGLHEKAKNKEKGGAKKKGGFDTRSTKKKSGASSINNSDLPF